MSKAATLKLFAGIRSNGLTGGAQWYDYQMVEADRLTLAFAAAADRAGADLANYIEAVDVVRDGASIAGMIVRDDPGKPALRDQSARHGQRGGKPGGRHDAALR